MKKFLIILFAAVCFANADMCNDYEYKKDRILASVEIHKAEIEGLKAFIQELIARMEVIKVATPRNASTLDDMANNIKKIRGLIKDEIKYIKTDLEYLEELSKSCIDKN